MAKPRAVYFEGNSGGLEERMRIGYLLPFRQLLMKDFDVKIVEGDGDLAKEAEAWDAELIVFSGGIESGKNAALPNISNIHSHPSIPRIGLMLNDYYGISRLRAYQYLVDCGCEAFFSVYSFAHNGIPQYADRQFYIPFWLHDEIYKDYGHEKIIPLGLYGAGFVDSRIHYPWRIGIARKVLGYFPCFTSSRPDSLSKTAYVGRSYAELLNRTKISFACGALTRAFTRKHLEICGCRSALFCEETPILKSLGFKDGEHCVYVNAETVREKVSEQLAQPEALAELTERGYQFVRAEHGLRQRNQLIEWYRLRMEGVPDGQKIGQPELRGHLRLVPESEKAALYRWDIRSPLEKIVDAGYEAFWRGNAAEAKGHFQKITAGIPGHIESRIGEVLCLMQEGRHVDSIALLKQLRSWMLENFGYTAFDPIGEALLVLSYHLIGKDPAVEISRPRIIRANHPLIQFALELYPRLGNGAAGSAMRGETVSLHYRLEAPEVAWQKVLHGLFRAANRMDIWPQSRSDAEAKPAKIASLRLLLENADKAAQQGDYEKAQQNLHAVIQKDRSCAEAYKGLAQILIKQGNFTDAWLTLKEAERVGGADDFIREKLIAIQAQVPGAEAEIRGYLDATSVGNYGRSTQPRRILVFTNLLPPQEMGGFGRTVWEFCDGLIQRGHAVRILTSDTPDLYRQPDQDVSGVERHVKRTLKLFGNWDKGAAVTSEDAQYIQAVALHNVRTILAEVAAFKPELCMAGNLDFLSGAMLDPIIKQGIPILHRLGNAHPSYHKDATPSSPLYCIASCSNWVNDELAKKGYKPGSFAVLPAGAPTWKYYRMFPPKFDHLRICYAGLVMGYKGPHLLVQALALLKSLGIGFTCEIAGDHKDPRYSRGIQALVAEKGLKDRVRFLGFQGLEGLSRMFDRSNTFVFPSVFEEPFGKVQIEAQAAGLAVVRSAVGGYKDMLEDEVNGLLFRPNDAEDLARQLYVLQGDKELWAKIAAQGQVNAFKFSTPQCVQILEEIMEALIATAK